MGVGVIIVGFSGEISFGACAGNQQQCGLSGKMMADPPVMSE